MIVVKLGDLIGFAVFVLFMIVLGIGYLKERRRK